MNYKFSIIIPYYAENSTIDFVKRQLNYYHNSTISMQVILAVSGDEQAKNLLKKYVNSLADVRFIWLDFMETNICNMLALVHKIINAVEISVTPYLILCGADDVVIPEVINEMCSVLENAEDVSIVVGATLYINIEKNNLKNYWASKARPLLYNAINDRVKGFLYSVSLFYSLNRRKDLLKCLQDVKFVWEQAQDIYKYAFFAEYFVALGLLSLGKCYVIDDIFMIKGIHKNNFGSHSTSHSDFCRFGIGLDVYKNFQKINSNMRSLSCFRHAWWMWAYRIRGSALTSKQIIYDYIYKDYKLSDLILLFIYKILQKTFAFMWNKVGNEQIITDKVNFVDLKCFELLKKYYFVET